MRKATCRIWVNAVVTILLSAIQSFLAFGALPELPPTAENAPDPSSPEGRLLAAGVGTETPQIIAFLNRHTQTSRDEKYIRKLIDQLGNEDFTKRLAAEKALIEVGDPALEALEAAKASKDLEVSVASKSLLPGNRKRNRAAFRRGMRSPRARSENRSSVSEKQNRRGENPVCC